MSRPGSSHTVVEHTGDIAIAVRARELADLYAESVPALFDVIVDTSSVSAREEVPVRIEGAADAEDLLVRFLSELLFLHDARGWLFSDACIDELAETALTARVRGEPFDPSRHAIARQVKAVTYHRLRLEREERGWSATIVLDL